MKKIPTLFERDLGDLSRVTSTVHPACWWVIGGEGWPTRMYDGACVMLDRAGRWWARETVSRVKPFPLHFLIIDQDPVTLDTIGWAPIEEYHPLYAMLREALMYKLAVFAGTYELIGPKIASDHHEKVAEHQLISHETAHRLPERDVPRSFDGLKRVLTDPYFPYKGIVWHHPDGRMAKVEVADFAAGEGGGGIAEHQG